MNFPGVHDRIEFPVTFSLKEREREKKRQREEEGRRERACETLFPAPSRLLVGSSATNELD